MLRLPDGHVVSHAMQHEASPSHYDTYRDYGITKARIDEVLYPDDPRNSTFNAEQKMMEYDCTIVGGVRDGQKLRNVQDSSGGSQFNRSIRVREPTTNQPVQDSENKPKTLPNKTNGSFVLIQRIGGNSDAPIIVGNFQNPMTTDFPKKEDGVFWEEEINGVKIRIDKEGAFSLNFGGGPKDKEGKPSNEVAAGTSVSVDKNGNFAASNNAGHTLSMNRENNQIDIGAGENRICLNTQSGQIDIAATGTTNINSQGALNVKSDGGIDYQGSIQTMQKGGVPAARMGDQCLGVGNHGAPVISNIIQGSAETLVGG